MKGFSLFELLIVLSIIAIVTMFAAPALTTLYFNSKSTTDINRLVRTLNYARNFAILEALPVMLCPESQRNECGNDWSKGVLVFVMRNGQNQLLKIIPEFTDASLTFNRKSNCVRC